MPSVEKDDVVIRFEIAFQIEGFAPGDIHRQIRKDISRVQFVTHWCLVCFCHALAGKVVNCEVMRSQVCRNETLRERLAHRLSKKLDNTGMNVGGHAIGGRIQHTGHTVYKPGRRREIK